MKPLIIKYYKCKSTGTIYDKKTKCKGHNKDDMETISIESMVKQYTCPCCGETFIHKGKNGLWGHKSKVWWNKGLLTDCDSIRNQSNLDKLYDDFNEVFDTLFDKHNELLTTYYIENLIGHVTKRMYEELYNLVTDKVLFKDIYKVEAPLQFSELSLQLTKSLTKKHKKECGIYFTHPSIVEQTIKLVKSYNIDIQNVLEPSCGSCEFINQLPNINIDGVEYDKEIYDKIKHLNSDKVHIVNEDFLKFKTDKTYELIFGNPPYFVIKKNDCSKEYHPYLDGRPNIYLLFILRSLTMLSENGIVAFVLPSNFLNCSYYNKVRQYIHDKYTLLNVLDCSNEFIDTDQPTNIILIQNKRPVGNNLNTLTMEHSIIFNTVEGITHIAKLRENSTTLDKLGFNVHVGTVVWNQVKDTLTDDSTKTRLIYSSDFKDNKLVVTHYKDPNKKNYIIDEGITGPLLVVNRGYGKGKYSFNYCLININQPFLIENHVICIKYRDTISKSELLKLYKSIIQSFKNPKTNEFINRYCTNDAINTTELQYVLPIYI